MNWVFTALVVTPATLIVLHPSWAEFLILMAVDVPATLLFFQIDGAIYKRLHPDSAPYFDGVDMDATRILPLAQRLRLLDSLMAFPARRARYCYFASFIKCLPALAIILFAWQYTHSIWLQLALAAGVCSISWLYFYYLVLTDNHEFISRTLVSLHEKCDFTEAFELLQIKHSARRASMREGILFALIYLSTLALQIILALSHDDAPGTQIAIGLSWTGLMGLALFSRIWFISRYRFTQCLMKLNQQLDQTEPTHNPIIPLSTNPTLNLFAQSINRLRRRVYEHERELSTLVLRQAEKSRFRDLGEMAALLAHDLSGPLHVAQFSASQLLEEPDMTVERRKLYFQHLSISLSRAVEQTTCLRSRIRNPSSGGKSVRFGEAHENVLSLLRPFATFNDLAIVQFTIDPALAERSFNIPRVDLIHILDNLYRTLVEILTEAQTATSTIRISFIEGTSAELGNILIHDNGPGFNEAAFEEATAFRTLRGQGGDGHTDTSQGLGLRLTRRLIEVNGGALHVIPAADHGSCICLTLPLIEAETSTPARLRNATRTEKNLQQSHSSIRGSSA